MNTDGPFAALGLGEDSSAAEVRDARRRLAKQHHPDRGGDPDRMRSVNEAAAAALRAIDARSASDPAAVPGSQTAGRPSTEEVQDAGGDHTWVGVAHDAPSFTVEALPVDTFEAMLVVASWLGEVIDEDPPYRLEVQLEDPLRCWCRLDVVPDAGGSTVSLTVAALPGEVRPDVIAVRDAWVDGLNRVDWS